VLAWDLRIPRGPVDSHLRLPNYSPQNIVRVCLNHLGTAERARRFPRREARTRVTVDRE
jgi:hypothetical protein